MLFNLTTITTTTTIINTIGGSFINAGVSTNISSFTLFILDFTVCPRMYNIYYAGQCYTDCPLTTAADYTGLTCVPCTNTLCNTCRFNSTDCLSCDPAKHLVLVGANCVPAPGYYNASTSSTLNIKKCPAPCLSCANTS